LNVSTENQFGDVNRQTGGLRVVALIEGTKGVLVLLVGFEALSFLHRDIHGAVVQLVEHFHLNPASHYPRIFLDAIEQVNDTGLWLMAVAAAMYSLARIIEAVGLWLRKRWAQWFAIVSGGVYVPIELYEVVQKATWPRLTLLIVNLGVVAYIVFELMKNGDKSTA
jgi:uncharacterized membrane protein (DUF2068 family)